MRHKLLSASCMVTIAVIGAAPAYANPNPHGASCQGSTSSPGNSATSPGSVHNEPGTVSLNGGNGGTAYNTAQANPNNNGKGVSQYDISCTRVSTNTNSTGNPVGTPITNNNVTSPTQVPNNSQATRTTLLGNTGHMGAGK